MSESIADKHYDSLSDDVTIFDPPGGVPALLYFGKNANPDALETDLTWIVKKFVYNGGQVEKIIKKKGAWSNRVSLF